MRIHMSQNPSASGDENLPNPIQQKAEGKGVCMSSREEFEKTMAPLFEENLGMNPDPSVWHKNKNGSYLNPVLEQHFVTWQAARATPALPQGEPEPVAMFCRAEHSGDLGLQWNPAFDPYEGALLYSEPPKPQALPQGVEEWIAENEHTEWKLMPPGQKFDRTSVYTDDLRAYLSGMEIVPDKFQAISNDTLRGLVDTLGEDLPDCIDNDGQPYQSQYLAGLLAAAKEKGE